MQVDPRYAAGELNKTFQDKSSSLDAKRRLAYGLAAVEGVSESDQDLLSFLIDRIADSPAVDSANLVEALSKLPNPDEVVGRILVQAKKQAQPDHALRNRYLVAAVSLGALNQLDQSLAPFRLPADGDPTPQTRFVSDFPGWPGDLQRIAKVLGQIETKDSEVRSGLCAAIGGVDPNSRSEKERSSVMEVLKALYQEAPDSGTHSAARWALRKWIVTLPELPRLALKADQDQLVEAKSHDWYVNSLGMTMLRVPQGNYRIGSQSESDNPPRDVPGAEFWLGDCEVTVGQFRKFLAERKVSEKSGESEAVTDLATPMTGVTWYDAVEFCNWLSKHEGHREYYKLEIKKRIDGGSIESGTVDIIPTGNGYRLPQEAEWEIACRAGSHTGYGFGNAKDDLHDFGWFTDNSRSKSHAVAEKRPNRWGFHDMHGNVWEWCEDEVGVDRVFRGGSWYRTAGSCKSAYRSRRVPSTRFDSLGFRVARSPSGK